MRWFHPGELAGALRLRRLPFADLNARRMAQALARTVELSGRLAQLGERLPYKQEVGGSIPSPPTRKTRAPRDLSPGRNSSHWR